MKRFKGRIRYIFLTIVLICLVICAIPAAAVGGSMLSHQLKLLDAARYFARVPHPPGTVKVDAYQEIGLLYGNGNHCDIFVGEMRTYNGDQSAIKNFYQQSQYDVGVIFPENGDFSETSRFELPYGHTRISEWKIPPGVDLHHLYVVFSADWSAEDPGFDLRCG
jgi:hypothetical protein